MISRTYVPTTNYLKVLEKKFLIECAVVALYKYPHVIPNKNASLYKQ